MIRKTKQCRQIKWTALFLVLLPGACDGLTVACEEPGADGSQAGGCFVEVPL